MRKWEIRKLYFSYLLKSHLIKKYGSDLVPTKLFNRYFLFIFFLFKSTWTCYYYLQRCMHCDKVFCVFYYFINWNYILIFNFCRNTFIVDLIINNYLYFSSFSSQETPGTIVYSLQRDDWRYFVFFFFFLYYFINMGIRKAIAWTF